MNKKVINTAKAPGAIGPYSQGMVIGNLIFTSGQLPIDMTTKELVMDDVKKAAKASIENVKAILEAEGSSLDKVVKTVIFLRDMNDFNDVNEVYGEYFKEKQPARSCVQVAKLPKNAPLEIEVIAEL